MLLGMVVEILSVIGISQGIVDLVESTSNNTPDDHTVSNFFEERWIEVMPLIIVGATMVLPIISSALSAECVVTKFFDSPLWYILVSGLPYFLFLPTLVAVFGAFSLARLFDFTWGNRDSGGAVDKLGNRAVTLEDRAKFTSPLFVMLNIAAVFLLSDLQDISPLVLLILTCLLFAPPLINFILSFFYFAYWKIFNVFCDYLEHQERKKTVQQKRMAKQKSKEVIGVAI